MEHDPPEADTHIRFEYSQVKIRQAIDIDGMERYHASADAKDVEINHLVPTQTNQTLKEEWEKTHLRFSIMLHNRVAQFNRDTL